MKHVPIQQNCYDKLSKLKVGALFMDAGAGKTLPAYNLVISAQPDYVLYIAPYQTIHNSITSENVVTEIEKYGGFDFDHDFVGIESIQMSDRIYLECLKKLQSHSNSFIVLDESIKIKNADAKRTNRLFELAKHSTYRLILNGTPISRNMLDIWAQMHFLSPKILSMLQPEYKNTFVEYTTMTKRIGSNSIKREWINGYHNLDHLYRLIEPFVFEASFDAGVKVQYIECDYELCEDSRKEYNDLKEFYLKDETLELKRNNIFLEISQLMQQVYCVTDQKTELLKNIISKNPKSKILVVCKFIKSQEFIREKFGASVMVLSYGKHAYGLNLQEYDIMVIWDRTFDYGAFYQVLRRIIRRGQTKKCRVFELNAKIPLEKLMKQNIEIKGKLLDAFKKKSMIEKLKEL